MNDVQFIDSQLISDAADASANVYGTSDDNDFAYWRKVEQFRLVGELAAAVRFAGDNRTAFVAIRGTSVLGNWLFTNFQAHFTPFNVVDDSLIEAPSFKYQGGHYRTPIHGTLHQGFFRAFSWLWYGTEPMMGDAERTRIVGYARLSRYVTLFLLFPVILWLFTQSWVASLVCALIVSFIFVTIEAGVWEDIFRDEPKVDGPHPFTLVERLNECDKVVFTGHSLGGAIAIIAFCVYRGWCRSGSDRKDNGVVVTFGAPRVGDVPFMTKFCELHRGRFAHVVHPGDPVPELPPNGLNELWHRKIWRRGFLGYAVMLIFPFWAAVGKLYRSNRAARWSDEALTFVDEPMSKRLRFGNHNMESVYREWARRNNSLCAAKKLS